MGTRAWWVETPDREAERRQGRNHVGAWLWHKYYHYDCNKCLGGLWV